jgi:hypothetical protein
MAGLSDEASMPASEASIQPELETSSATTPNITTNRSMGGSFRRKAAKRTFPWLPVAAEALISTSPPEDEEFPLPIAKKPRFEVPLLGTTEETTTKVVLPHVDVDPKTARTLNASADEVPSSGSIFKNEVELTRVVKPTIQMKHNSKESWKQKGASIVAMQRRTHIGGVAGCQPSNDQQTAGLAGSSTTRKNTFTALLNIPTKLNNIDSSLTQAWKTAVQNKPSKMPAGYIPSDMDVCCGRGKRHWDMVGNVKFQQVINAPLKYVQHADIASVVNDVRSQGGHFLKKERRDGSGCWDDIGDVAARAKVGHLLRKLLANQHSLRAVKPTFQMKPIFGEESREQDWAAAVAAMVPVQPNIGMQWRIINCGVAGVKPTIHTRHNSGKACRKQDWDAGVAAMAPLPIRPNMGVQWGTSNGGVAASQPRISPQTAGIAGTPRVSTFPLVNAPAKFNYADYRVSHQNKPATNPDRDEVELICGVKPTIQMELNSETDCKKQERAAGIAGMVPFQSGMKWGKSNRGVAGWQPSSDQQTAGLGGTRPISTVPLLNAPAKSNDVNSSLTQTSIPKKPAKMPAGYIPSDVDVCCGRGKKSWSSAGNIKYQQVINASSARYMAAPTKHNKSKVIVLIVDEIRRQGGHFLKEQRQGRHFSKEQKPGGSGCWDDIGDAAARVKVGHSLRNSDSARQRQNQQPIHQCRSTRQDQPPPTQHFPVSSSQLIYSPFASEFEQTRPAHKQPWHILERPDIAWYRS